MDRFDISIIAVFIVGIFMVVVSSYLGINYAYRWNAACVAAHGQKMENTSNTPICVKEPVVLVSIAAKPW